MEGLASSLRRGTLFHVWAFFMVNIKAFNLSSLFFEYFEGVRATQVINKCDTATEK